MRRVLTPLFAVAVCVPGLVVQAQQAPLQQFQHLEDSWSVALVNKDQFGLENLLSPTFVGISAAGQVTTRNQYISDTLNGLPTPLLSVEQKVVSTRVVSDVAIVEGTYMLRLRATGDRVQDERGIFTHVYVRSRDTWSCMNAQRTAVVSAIEGAKAPPKTKKKSNAALPFHIPLIH